MSTSHVQLWSNLKVTLPSKHHPQPRDRMLTTRNPERARRILKNSETLKPKEKLLPGWKVLEARRWQKGSIRELHPFKTLVSILFTIWVLRYCRPIGWSLFAGRNKNPDYREAGSSMKDSTGWEWFKTLKTSLNQKLN